MSIEAMKQALKALEEPHAHIAKQLRLEAIHAIKESLQAIAEPEKQEQGEPLIWSTTQGGAYECGEYLVAQRVDGKGWNALGEHKQLLLGASLEDCKSICERDAVESLAKQEQGEPVAYINIEKRRLEWAHDYMSWDTPTVFNLPRIPLYTTPQQRAWVQLTDEEIQECLNGLPTQTIDVYAKRIEAKLKELNI